MKHVAYVYIPRIARGEVMSLLDVLSDCGVTLTHLGKNDPVSKWTRDSASAIQTILDGEDVTNITFFRAKQEHVEGTIEIHRDRRWTHDTVSLSGQDEWLLGKLACGLDARTSAYLTIIGRLGAGTNQAWTALGIKSDCPAGITSRITLARPDLGMLPHDSQARHSEVQR